MAGVSWIKRRMTLNSAGVLLVDEREKQKESTKYSSNPLKLVLVVAVFVCVGLYVSCNNNNSMTTATVTTAATKECPTCPAPSSSNAPPSEMNKNNQRALSSVRWPTHETHGALGFIHRHQFPVDCSKASFIVWPFPRDTRNLGALYTTIGHWLSFAISNNRVLLLDDRDWMLGDCESHNTQCYFLPHSGCTLKDTEGLSTHELKSTSETPDKSKKVWVTPDRWWISNEQDNIWDTRTSQHPCHWHSYAMLFFFRLQPALERRIEDNVKAALDTLPGFNPAHAIGMPIRASDKCRGHSLAKSANGEVDCIPLGDYLDRAKRVRAFDPSVDTIILTSEDSSVVEEIANSSANKADGWKFLLNIRDIRQGTGSASALTHQAKTDGKESSLSKIMESALTSLHLQLRSRYLLTSQQSSWLLVISLFHKCDQCTYVEDRMQFYIGNDKKPNYYC